MVHTMGCFLYYFLNCDAIDPAVETLVAYRYGCKGNEVSVPQNVNIFLYINNWKHFSIKYLLENT